jgi:uncharacterized protein (TIGR02246 family)
MAGSPEPKPSLPESEVENRGYYQQTRLWCGENSESHPVINPDAGKAKLRATRQNITFHRPLVPWTLGQEANQRSFSNFHFMKTIALFIAITLTFTALLLAQDSADNSPEKTAIMSADRAYEAAYAKADAKALADFFSDDAQYTADDGQTFNGRAEIENSIKSAFQGNKGAKLTIKLDSVRVLGPEVVLEKGSTTVTAKNGDTSGAQYAAIYVKKDGKWKINQLIETPLADISPHDRLAELGWLIGPWEEADKSDNLSIRSDYVWARGGNFITRNVTVKRGDETTLEGWQVIGWDPVDHCIRSWTFDDEGGFAEGRWTRDGERWLLRERGITPDGDRTSADNTFAKISNDRFTWESNNRTLNGDPQPGIPRIEINRVKGQ